MGSITDFDRLIDDFLDGLDGLHGWGRKASDARCELERRVNSFTEMQAVLAAFIGVGAESDLKGAEPSLIPVLESARTLLARLRGEAVAQ